MEIKEGVKTDKAPFKVEDWKVAQSTYGNYCQGVAADLFGAKVVFDKGKIVYGKVREGWVDSKKNAFGNSVENKEYSKLVVAYDALTLGRSILKTNRLEEYVNGGSKENCDNLSEELLKGWKESFGDKGEEVAKKLAETQEERIYLLTNIGGEESNEAIYSLYEKVESEGAIETLKGMEESVKRGGLDNGRENLNRILLPMFTAEVKAVYGGDGKYVGNKESIKKIKVGMEDDTYKEYRGGEYLWKDKVGIKEFDLGVLEEIKKGEVKFNEEGMIESMSMGWKNEKELKNISDNWRTKDGSRYKFESLLITSMERVCLNYWIQKEKTGISFEEYFGKNVNNLKKNPGMVIGRDVGGMFAEYSFKLFKEKRFREVSRKLLVKYHPNGSNPNEERFKELNEVFRKLDKGEYSFRQ